MADLVVVPADVELKASAEGLLEIRAAGEDLERGDVAYLKTGNEFWKADADNTSVTASARGIVISPAATGNWAVVLVSGGKVDLGVALVVGTTYVVSDTPGGIKPIGDLGSGDYNTRLGVASATDQLDLSIEASGVQVP